MLQSDFPYSKNKNKTTNKQTKKTFHKMVSGGFFLYLLITPLNLVKKKIDKRGKIMKKYIQFSVYPNCT